MVIYRIKEGDTLHSIARSHAVLPTCLAEDNGLAADAALPVGMALLIRSPEGLHRVGEGEDVRSIARRHRISRARLLQLNPALGASPPYPGMTLSVLPCEPPHGAILVLGYALAATPPEEIAPLFPYLSYLAILSCRMGKDGRLTPPEDSALVKAARCAGVCPLLCLTAAKEDLPAMADPTRRQAVAEGLLALLQKRGYEGVLLDMDIPDKEPPEGYLLLLSLLRRRLGHTATVLSTLPPEGECARVLGRAAGGIVLETHAFSSRYASPAPAAPYDRVECAVRSAAEAVRPAKLLMGISTRAEDFPVHGGEGRVLPYATVAEIAAAGARGGFDPVGRIPYLSYREGGEDRILFYEDTASLFEKLMLLEQHGLGGIALHPLVGTARPLLLLLAELFRIIKPHRE